MEGDERFDELKSEVTSQKSQVFGGDNFTATLDGEHLDKEAHPDDLLNTHLAPGVRKLPSELDVEILQALLDSAEE
jgi:large repetitive protein